MENNRKGKVRQQTQLCKNTGQPSKQHTIELMRKAVKDYDKLMKKFKPNMDKIVEEYSWTTHRKKLLMRLKGSRRIMSQEHTGCQDE